MENKMNINMDQFNHGVDKILLDKNGISLSNKESTRGCFLSYNTIGAIGLSYEEKAITVIWGMNKEHKLYIYFVNNETRKIIYDQILNKLNGIKK